MATLYITEYSDAYAPIGIAIPCGKEPALADQTVAIGASSAQSAAFSSTTRFIRIHTDAICSVKIGANPTATATNRRLAAGQTEFVGVNPSDKLAVITNT